MLYVEWLDYFVEAMLAFHFLSDKQTDLSFSVSSGRASPMWLEQKGEIQSPFRLHASPPNSQRGRPEQRGSERVRGQGRGNWGDGGESQRQRSPSRQTTNPLRRWEWLDKLGGFEIQVFFLQEKERKATWIFNEWMKGCRQLQLIIFLFKAVHSGVNKR